MFLREGSIPMELRNIDERHVDATLRDPGCLRFAAAYLGQPKDQLRDLISREQIVREDLKDAVVDALMNEAPVVREFLAEQSKGVFPINIAGVEGAYYVWAQEYDAVGLFDSIDQAESYVQSEYGEFLVDGGNNEGDD